MRIKHFRTTLIALASSSAALIACGDSGSKPTSDVVDHDTSPLFPSDIAFPDSQTSDSASQSDDASPADITATPDTATAPDTASTADVAVDDTSMPTDTAAPEDTVVTTDDTTQPGDTVSTPGTTGPVVEGCENKGFPALSAGYNDFGDLVIMEAYDADLPPFGVLGLELYDNVMREPGSREIFAQNYSDCKVCVRIRTGCGAFGCEDFWLATEGRVVIDSWDTHFTGYLDGLAFQKVTIDPDTNVSTEVDGEGWCIDRFYFNIQIDR